jgi:hypothetical protein
MAIPYDKANRQYNQTGRTYNSFAGTDIVAVLRIPGLENAEPLVLGSLQTLSYSSHRESTPVRTLGRVSPKGHTAGPRTVAGSLIFTVFDRNIVREVSDMILRSASQNEDIVNDAGDVVGTQLRYSPDNWTRKGVRPADESGWFARQRVNTLRNGGVMMDEMPPFDIIVTFGNEYGNSSYLVIKGVVIVDEGQVMSIEDMLTENTYSYMAEELQVLDSLGYMGGYSAEAVNGGNPNV